MFTARSQNLAREGARGSIPANVPFANAGQLFLERVRSFNLASYSDGDLRIELMRLRYGAQSLEVEDVLSQAFAIVAEAVDRRLGVWRLLEGSFDRSFDWRSLGDQWVNVDPQAAHLGADEQVIADSIARVTQDLKVKQSWDILLPAEVYGAVRRKDEGNGLEFRATDEQLLAGLNLFQGAVVQMNAGEGKTVAAAFTAVAHALWGRAVHVITANDYLASRDANLLAPVYESLGISVGAVLGYMEDDERSYNYQQSIVYGAMRELGFDYLRDNLKVTVESQVQGKLEAAIIDEVDHALIDEALTPMIISGSPMGNRSSVTKVKKAVRQLIDMQREAAKGLADRLSSTGLSPSETRRLLAQLLLAEPDNAVLSQNVENNPGQFKKIKLLAESDQAELSLPLLYAIDPEDRFVTLTDLGGDMLVESLGPFYDGRALEESLDGIWGRRDLSLQERRKKAGALTRRLARQYNLGNQVYQMLRACLLLKRDVDYLVTEDSLVLIDKSTGRPKTDCVYQHGLQSALEAKEGITPHPETETLGRISVEGFTKRYQSISGMTGTASGAAAEFQQRYGLRVEELSPTRPLMRVDLAYRVYLNRREKTSAIIDQVISCHRVGQPVLVGTQTVEQSEEFSRLLREGGVPHNLLNAVNSEDEAATVRDAGAFGAVTVATNMAGRGTDILLETNLDQMIAQRYVGVAEQLLAGEVGVVVISCHSSQEAEILSTAISASLVLSIVKEEGFNGPQLKVTLKPGKDSPDGQYNLDFSLGLRVIGTEINETPRIGLQLNGRSGRQGAFGVTQTFLALDDRLLNLEVESILKLSKCRRTDTSGRTYFAGKAVDRHIARVQRIAEQESEAQRGLVQDYADVLDRQTSLFYRHRRQSIDSAMDSLMLNRFSRELTARLAPRFFPGITLELYAAQFDRMVAELQLDYQVDCSLLRGCDLALLPEELGHLFISKLEEMESKAGPKEFSGLARRLYLNTCDDLWKDHMAELQDSISNQMLSNADHKSAVAHYVLRSSKAWDEFLVRVNAEFLSRLLTFPIDEIEPRAREKVQVNEEARMLIAHRPMAIAVANDQQRRD